MARRRGARRRRHAAPLRAAVADDARASRRCRARACSTTTTSRRPSSSRPSTPALVRLSMIGAPRARRRSRATWTSRSASPSSTAASSTRSASAQTAVLPIVVDVERLTGAGPVPSLERLLQDGLANILFVGRIAPNKKIEDHIRLAEHVQALRRRVLPLHLRRAHRRRAALLRRRSGRSSPSTGCCRSASGSRAPCPIDELAAYYRNAHAYVSLSEHEGFCVPLVEAMAMDVPVLAYARAAVPETLGGAGVSFRAEGSRTGRRAARRARLRRAVAPAGARRPAPPA